MKPLRPARRTRLAYAIVVAASALALASCASAAPGSDTPTGQSLGSTYPAPPGGAVSGVGLVMDVAGEVELCLGPIAESYPPQCAGTPIEGWTWDGIDGYESSGETTWGMYAVQGTYDGQSFTLTQPPIMLALYDPMIEEPPAIASGDTDEATLLAIQDELPEALGVDYFTSSIENGYLWVSVLWDDGTWQAAADADFGENVVFIRPALRPID